MVQHNTHAGLSSYLPPQYTQYNTIQAFLRHDYEVKSRQRLSEREIIGEKEGKSEEEMKWQFTLRVCVYLYMYSIYI